MLANILAVIFGGALHGIPKYKALLKIIVGVWVVLGIIIEVGSRKPVDFYQAGLDAIKQEKIAVDGGLAIDMTPVIIAYRRATGIKLSEYGLANLIIGGKE